MNATKARPNGHRATRVKLTTDKVRVGMVMTRELYEQVQESAVNDSRTVSSWIVRAALEKLERESEA